MHLNPWWWWWLSPPSDSRYVQYFSLAEKSLLGSVWFLWTKSKAYKDDLSLVFSWHPLIQILNHHQSELLWCLSSLLSPHSTTSPCPREIFTWVDSWADCGTHWPGLDRDENDRRNVKYTHSLSLSHLAVWSLQTGHWLNHSWSLPNLDNFSLPIIHHDLSVVYWWELCIYIYIST